MKEKKEERIKAIIFDVGGVLALEKDLTVIKGTQRNLGVHQYMAKKLKISLDQWIDAIDTTYAKGIEGKISEKKALSIIAKNVKTSAKKLEKISFKAYKKNFKQNKELYKIVFKLKKKDYKIAILSDQWYISKKALILPKYSKKFNVVIVSCDVGFRKPNPKIYRLALKKLKLPADRCLFVDNQEWNIKPAKKIGMKTILFKNNQQFIKELKKLRIKI